MSEKQHEGKLKQGLDEIFLNAQKDVGAHKIGITTAVLIADQQLKSYELVEKTKADFPTNEDAIWRAKTEGVNLSADNIERCRSFLAQIWFKKWFGEAKKDE